MRKLALIAILTLSLTSCKAIDVIMGIGAGASVAGFLAPPLLQARGQVKPKDILGKIDLAYTEHRANITTLMANTGLTPKERRYYVKEETKTLHARLKAYNRLLMESYGLPNEIVDVLSGKEGQEFIGEIAKVLPPPWNELAPTGASLGLLIATIFGYRGRGRFRNIALLLGNTVEGLKKSGVLEKDKLIAATRNEASEHRLNMADLHTFLKRYNVS